MESPDYIRRDKIKQTFITRTAIRTLKSEQLVEQVVNFCYQSVNEALKSNNQIELTGLGNFLVSPNKLSRTISKKEMLLRHIRTSLERNPDKATNLNKKINNLEYEIQVLKNRPKLNEFLTSMGRMEEPPVPTSPPERTDQENL